MCVFRKCWLTGGIVPVLKTDDMTQPVGVAQDGRLYTAPSGSEEVEEEIAELDTRVTTLENQQAAGGGNTYVCVTDQNTVFTGFLSLTYTTLPAGAVVDKYEVIVGLSGNTVPVSMEIYPTGAGLGISAAPGGGYCNWAIASSTSGEVTITTLNMGTNTLYPYTLTAADTIRYARIYYHI